MRVENTANSSLEYPRIEQIQVNSRLE